MQVLIKSLYPRNASRARGFSANKWMRQADRTVLNVTISMRLAMPAHRRWMIRNYCLTFAAVTLRIYLPLSLVFHADFLSAYQVISEACWVPNLLEAEWLISRVVTERGTTPFPG